MSCRRVEMITASLLIANNPGYFLEIFIFYRRHGV